MTTLNWQKLYTARQIRRYGTEQISRPKPLSKNERKLLAYKDPGKIMLSRLYTITIKCYHCGHTGRVTVKPANTPPSFKCSRCGHKGYPQKRINRNAQQTAVV